MDLWLEAEIRMRRDDAFAAAGNRRTIRMVESGRSRSIRGRIADGAQNVVTAQDHEIAKERERHGPPLVGFDGGNETQGA